MGFLDVKVNPATIDPLVAGKITTPGTAVATALNAGYGPAAQAESVELKSAFQPSITLSSYYGNYGNGDDQAAVTNALDDAKQRGGAKVVIPSGYNPVVQQLVLARGIEFCSNGNFQTFGRDGNVSRIIQASGVNDATIVFDNDVLTQYGAARPFIGPLAIHDLVFSKPAGAGGHHIAVRTQDGREAKIQDYSTFERLGFRGGSGSGIYINGGSPVVLKNMAGIGLGGYVVEMVDLGRDTIHGDIHQVSISNISGDACMGYALDNYGAVILLKGTMAHTVQTFRDIKSEFRVRYPSDGGDPAETPQAEKKMGNYHALILDNCQSSVIASGVGHIATGDTVTTPQTRRPGAAILIKGANRPKLSFEGVKIRVTAAQTVGAMPGSVRDEVSASPIDIPIDSSAGSYATTLDRRDIAASSSGTRWVKGTPGQAFPSVASPLESLGGTTPSRSWWESDADADEKLWSATASSGNYSIRTHTDTGSAGVLAMEMLRTGTDVTETRFAKKVSGQEFEALSAVGGLVLKSANGTRYRVQVSDAGALTITAA
ncbi:hypothetical protein F8G81_16450 [Arthrobacter sp. CDRTa11]|uniref:hypothetical protein n=1 Tax=Arthrobacter sp. CDRTa11 TaxID=2651199 RepID=UPI002265A2D5|nr:hypothetical protein [Arthrobacter sp. CDRTa11]UZX04014.1 hypothetical protein F8G81_16450 [Arthrobacter sp. CDRTa11]